MQAEQDLVKTRSFINNEWASENLVESFLVKNKFTQKVIGEVSKASSSEINDSLRSSQEAFKEMSAFSNEKKSELLLKIKSELQLEKDKFINLIVAEAGKPINYARAEIERALFILDQAAHLALHFKGEMVPVNFGIGTGKTAYTTKKPIGPVLALSPFNFPLNLALHKIAPAIAVGCPVILKPSPYTPLTALALASLCRRAGLPAGALNVVICDNQGVLDFLKDDAIKMFSFTGSAQVGWFLKEKAARKKVVLELGGNAAAIIDRTADLDLAAKNLAMSAYNYAGQVCVSCQRIYVDESVFDLFVKKFQAQLESFKIGNPEDEETVVGPLIDSIHLERIDQWVKESVAGGSVLLSGGKIISEKENLYAPTLLTGTKSDMKVVSEEIFGPVAIVEKVQFFDQVIKEVNQSAFGLQTSLYTNQISQMKYAYDHLVTGALIVNAPPNFRIDTMPYGGVKESGFGREGLLYAMNEMCHERLLVY